MSNGNLPRVTSEQIAALMSRVLYSLEARPLGSTSTLVHAFLDGTFYLASGHSACVSPEAFNAERGLEVAKENAMKAAEDALWKYEGYALMKRLQEPAVLTLKSDVSDADIAQFRAAWGRSMTIVHPSGSSIEVAAGSTIDIASNGDVTITGDATFTGNVVGLGEDGPLQAVGI